MAHVRKSKYSNIRSKAVCDGCLEDSQLSVQC